MIYRSKAPLRLGLAGGGTDVSPFSDTYGGYTLNATIDMYAYCTIRVTDNNKIIFHSIDKNMKYETDSALRLELDGEFDLYKGVYNKVLELSSRKEPLSFEISTYSDAPAGSGLGSSSTLVVAMIKAFENWLKLPLGDYDIAHLAYEIERVDVGLSGGKQDQYATTFGGINFIEFYEKDRVIVNPLRVSDWIINELENSLVLYYTGVSRESANIIDEQSRVIKNEKKEALDAMKELKDDALVMKESLLKGNLDLFSEYLAKSWFAKKRTASTISNKNIDETYNLAINAGAKSGKVSGAGGGGFMMFMVDPVKRLNLVRALSTLQGNVMNFHFTQRGAISWRPRI